MEQYGKNGPPPQVPKTDAKDHVPLINQLEQRVESLEKQAREQDRVIRKLRNDLRASVNAINRMNNG